MPIVTLTTDLGTKDFYAGVLKGQILASNPDASIIDITHDIPAYNIIQGAYTIRNAFPTFPEGTIHVISVDSSEKEDGRLLLVKRKGQFFIMPDNGLISLIFDHSPGDVYQLEKNRDGVDPFNRVVSDTIKAISSGRVPAEIGRETTNYQQRTILHPVLTGSVIRGTIIHIDNFDNAMVNVSKELFNGAAENGSFEIIFNRNIVSQIHAHYSDVLEGEMLCRFNGSELLEIAINKGKAASLLGLQVGGAVIIDFG